METEDENPDLVCQKIKQYLWNIQEGDICDDVYADLASAGVLMNLHLKHNKYHSVIPALLKTESLLSNSQCVDTDEYVMSQEDIVGACIKLIDCSLHFLNEGSSDTDSPAACILIVYSFRTMQKSVKEPNVDGKQYMNFLEDLYGESITDNEEDGENCAASDIPGGGNELKQRSKGLTAQPRETDSVSSVRVPAAGDLSSLPFNSQEVSDRTFAMNSSVLSGNKQRRKKRILDDSDSESGLDLVDYTLDGNSDRSKVGENVGFDDVDAGCADVDFNPGCDDSEESPPRRERNSNHRGGGKRNNPPNCKDSVPQNTRQGVDERKRSSGQNSSNDQRPEKRGLGTQLGRNTRNSNHENAAMESASRVSSDSGHCEFSRKAKKDEHTTSRFVRSNSQSDNRSHELQPEPGTSRSQVERWPSDFPGFEEFIVLTKKNFPNISDSNLQVLLAALEKESRKVGSNAERVNVDNSDGTVNDETETVTSRDAGAACKPNRTPRRSHREANERTPDVRSPMTGSPESETPPSKLSKRLEKLRERSEKIGKDATKDKHPNKHEVDRLGKRSKPTPDDDPEEVSTPVPSMSKRSTRSKGKNTDTQVEKRVSSYLREPESRKERARFRRLGGLLDSIVSDSAMEDVLISLPRAVVSGAVESDDDLFDEEEEGRANPSSQDSDSMFDTFLDNLSPNALEEVCRVPKPLVQAVTKPSQNIDSPLANAAQPSQDVVNASDDTLNPSEDTENPSDDPVNSSRDRPPSVSPSSDTVTPSKGPVTPSQGMSPSLETGNPSENTTESCRETRQSKKAHAPGTVGPSRKKKSGMMSSPQSNSESSQNSITPKQSSFDPKPSTSSAAASSSSVPFMFSPAEKNRLNIASTPSVQRTDKQESHRVKQMTLTGSKSVTVSRKRSGVQSSDNDVTVISVKSLAGRKRRRMLFNAAADYLDKDSSSEAQTRPSGSKDSENSDIGVGRKCLRDGKGRLAVIDSDTDVDMLQSGGGTDSNTVQGVVNLGSRIDSDMSVLPKNKGIEAEVALLKEMVSQFKASESVEMVSLEEQEDPNRSKVDEASASPSKGQLEGNAVVNRCSVESLSTDVEIGNVRQEVNTNVHENVAQLGNEDNVDLEKVPSTSDEEDFVETQMPLSWDPTIIKCATGQSLDGKNAESCDAGSGQSVSEIGAGRAAPADNVRGEHDLCGNRMNGDALIDSQETCDDDILVSAGIETLDTSNETPGTPNTRFKEMKTSSSVKNKSGSSSQSTCSGSSTLSKGVEAVGVSQCSSDGSVSLLKTWPGKVLPPDLTGENSEESQYASQSMLVPNLEGPRRLSEQVETQSEKALTLAPENRMVGNELDVNEPQTGSKEPLEEESVEDRQLNCKNSNKPQSYIGQIVAFVRRKSNVFSGTQLGDDETLASSTQKDEGAEKSCEVKNTDVIEMPSQVEPCSQRVLVDSHQNSESNSLFSSDTTPSVIVISSGAHTSAGSCNGETDNVSAQDETHRSLDPEPVNVLMNSESVVAKHVRFQLADSETTERPSLLSQQSTEGGDTLSEAESCDPIEVKERNSEDILQSESQDADMSSQSDDFSPHRSRLRPMNLKGQSCSQDADVESDNETIKTKSPKKRQSKRLRNAKSHLCITTAVHENGTGTWSLTKRKIVDGASSRSVKSWVSVRKKNMLSIPLPWKSSKCKRKKLARSHSVAKKCRRGSPAGDGDGSGRSRSLRSRAHQGGPLLTGGENDSLEEEECRRPDKLSEEDIFETNSTEQLQIYPASQGFSVDQEEMRLSEYVNGRSEPLCHEIQESQGFEFLG